jgi:hypothetical protein
LEDIKSLRPLGSTSSTGIRVFVTVLSSWGSSFFCISSTLNFYVWFSASGSTHINCLKGWNHIWNENSRRKNSDCWMKLNFSATERKLYGLILMTLGWFLKYTSVEVVMHSEWVLTGMNSFSKELSPSQATAPVLHLTRWSTTFLKMGVFLSPEVWTWLYPS